MGKMSASDMTYYIAKAGDIVKGSGKGDMKTGAALIIAGAVVTGGAVAVGAQKVAKLFKNKKKK